MEKKKKKVKRILGLRIGELCAFAALMGTLMGTVAGGVHYLDRKFEHIDQKFEAIDRRFEAIDRRFEHIELRLGKIEAELTQTSNLLNQYLTWRFIYINDPVRKHLVPIYDPGAKTIEFVDPKNAGK